MPTKRFKSSASNATASYSYFFYNFLTQFPSHYYYPQSLQHFSLLWQIVNRTISFCFFNSFRSCIPAGYLFRISAHKYENPKCKRVSQRNCTKRAKIKWIAIKINTNKFWNSLKFAVCVSFATWNSVRIAFLLLFSPFRFVSCYILICNL